MEVDSSEIERSDLDADSEVHIIFLSDTDYIRASHETLLCCFPGWGCDEERSEEILLSSPDKPVGGRAGVERLHPPVEQQQQTEQAGPVRPGGGHQQVEEVEHQHHRQSGQSGQSNGKSGRRFGPA